MSLLYVALGGALGASARYLVGAWLGAWLGPGFPWGTLFANMSGSFLIGVVLVLVDGGTLPEGARPLLAVGLLGGYTTFSSFSHESLRLLADTGAFLALMNLFGQVFLGLVFVYLGIVVGRLLGGA
ncbi:MAG: fluoride efflux transporter CrcB [Rubrobacteraceae bacterium]